MRIHPRNHRHHMHRPVHQLRELPPALLLLLSMSCDKALSTEDLPSSQISNVQQHTRIVSCSHCAAQQVSKT